MWLGQNPSIRVNKIGITAIIIIPYFELSVATDSEKTFELLYTYKKAEDNQLSD